MFKLARAATRSKTFYPPRACRIFLVLLAGCAAFSNTVLEAAGFPLENTGTERWMSALPNDTLVTQMIVPGSHDSAAWGTFLPAYTQAHNIYGQLMGGVRFFDIRIRDCNDCMPSGFKVVHGDRDHLYLNLGELEKVVLNPVRSFLQTYPNEAIFMSVSNEGGTFNAASFNTRYINTPRPYPLYLDATVETKLGEIRGKIVLFDRMKLNQGINWVEDGPVMGYQDESTLDCGWWPFSCGSGHEKKWTSIRAFLERALAHAQGNRFWINFASANRPPLGTGIDENSRYQNQRVLDFLKDNRTRLGRDFGSFVVMDNATGITADLFDRATANYAQSLVAENFLRLAKPSVDQSSFEIELKSGSSSYFRLESAVGGTGSKLCLGVEGVDSHSAGAGVVAFHCHPGSERRLLDHDWSFEAGGEAGYLSLKNRATGLCLSSQSPGSPNRVRMQPCGFSGSEDWLLESEAGARFQLKNRNTNLCLGVAGINSNQSGSPAQLEACAPEGSDSAMDRLWHLTVDGYDENSDLRYLRAATGWPTNATEDPRETLVRELEQRSGSTYGELWTEDDMQIAGQVRLYLWLSRSMRLPPDYLHGMTLGDQRNTAIVLLNAHLGEPVPALQALDDLGLHNKAKEVDGARATLRRIAIDAGWRTASEAEAMSADEMRNLFVVELHQRLTADIPGLSALPDRDLGSWAKMYLWFLERKMNTEAELKTFTLAKLRAEVIQEINYHAGETVPGLESLAVFQLAARAELTVVGEVYSVLLDLGWRRAVELKAMSPGDMRNTLIVELDLVSSDNVPYLQGKSDHELVGFARQYQYLKLHGHLDSELAAKPFVSIKARIRSQYDDLRCLDYRGPNSPILMWNCSTASSPSWELDDQDRIRQSSSNQCLDLEGTSVLAKSCNGNLSQKWWVDHKDRLRSKQYEMCLDIRETRDGAQPFIYECDSRGSQQWYSEESTSDDHRSLVWLD